jgi:hypothetical protein
VQLVLLGALPELAEHLLQGRDLFIAHVRQQFRFDAGGNLQGIRDQLLSGRRQARVENPPVAGARFALDETLALERRENLDDRLRPHADFPRERRCRDFVHVAQAIQHEELRGREIELRERDLDATADRELGALQQIDRAHRRFAHDPLIEVFGGTI